MSPAGAVSGDSLRLSWQAPAHPGRLSLEGFHIQEADGPAWDVAGTELTVGNLVAGERYQFTVSAYNAVTEGDPVSIAVTTPAPTPVFLEASAPAAWTPPANYLRAEDGMISTSVGYYYTLAQPVPEWEAVLDRRMTMVPYYFDGHNPGVFTGLLSEHEGSVLDYWDGHHTLHRFRVIAIRSWDRYSGEPPPVSGDVVAQFQTCRTLDGSVIWVYDAVAA